MKKKRDIEFWMLLVMVLLTACSDHSGGGSEETEDCFLNIYVYGPGRPMLTRADVGDIASRSVEEHMVRTLQIWVFKHSNGDKVGYLETKPTFLNETNGQEMFQMKVEKTFADHPVNVDVYVVANAYVVPDNFDKFINCEKNYNLTYIDDNNEVTLTLGESTTRAQLDAAKIGESSFGVGNGTFVENSVVSPVSKVPSAGLPMSAVEKDQPIYGSFPALRIGSQDKMTTLQLTRAVSKLRFVLCRIAAEEEKELVSIDGIQLDGEMIPTKSYLMPGTYTYSSNPAASTDYEDDPIVYVNSENNSENKLLKTAIPAVENPMDYAYETQTAQEYENLINHAINEEKLKELGLTYLRESDKQLTGMIQYKIKDIQTQVQTDKEAVFSMAAPGDFRRNRSWIIYVFYMDAQIHVLTVTDIGVKKWTSDNNDEDKMVYNW